MKDEKNTGIEELKKQMGREIENKITDTIRSLIAQRDENEVRMYRIEESLASQVTQKNAIERDLTKLIRESTDGLASGKDDPAKRSKIRTLKADLTEAQEWIETIEGNALPAARAAYNKAQMALTDAIRGALVGLKVDYEAKMNGLIEQAMDVVDSWVSATGNLYTTLRASVHAGSIDEIPLLDGRSERFSNLVRSVFGR